MSTPSLEELPVIIDFERIAEAWIVSKQGNHVLERVRITAFVLQSSAKGKPISVEEFAEFSDQTLMEAKVQYRKMRMSGADFGDEGRLIGNALTMRPTRTIMTMDGRKLYAWCALDTLFLPGLVGESATVHSISPVSSDPIRLTVSPKGVESFNPTEAVLSVVLPGVSIACELGRPGGADGDVCNAMHFFSDREEAVGYLGEGTDIAILTVEEASELAQRAWVRPYRSALESEASMRSSQ